MANRSQEEMKKLRDLQGHIHAVADSLIPPAIDRVVHTAFPCINFLLPEYCNPAQGQHVQGCSCNPPPSYSNQPPSNPPPGYSNQPHYNPPPSYSNQPPSNPPPSYSNQPPSNPPSGYSNQPPCYPPPGYSNQPHYNPPPSYGNQPPSNPPPGYSNQPPYNPPPSYSNAPTLPNNFGNGNRFGNYNTGMNEVGSNFNAAPK